MAKIRVRQSQLINSLKEGYTKGLLAQVGWLNTIEDDKHLYVEDLPTSMKLEKDRKGCQGCAVGNIFAELLSPDTSIKKLAAHIEGVVRSEGDSESCACGLVDEDILDDLLLNHRYLTALSHVFEGTMDNEGDAKEALDACIDLIKTRFPKTITLDIDGFTPKRKSGERRKVTRRAKVPGLRSKSTRRKNG